MKTISFKLSQVHWQLFVHLVKCVATAERAIDGYELESCVIAEFYRQRLHDFTFYRKSSVTGMMQWTIPLSVASAIDLFYGDLSANYNKFLRQFINPYLPTGVQRIDTHILDDEKYSQNIF